MRASKGSVMHMPVPIENTLDHVIDTLPSMHNMEIKVVDNSKYNLLQDVSIKKVYFSFFVKY